MTRSDVHSPKRLITEDYEFVGCGNFPTAELPGYSPLVHEAAYLLDEGWGFGENESAGECYHCGAHLTYYAILKHLPTRTLIRVGETCLANRFERATAEFHSLRAQSALDRQQQRIKKMRERFRTDHAEFVAALDAENARGANGESTDSFLMSLYLQLQRKGELSERQIDAGEQAIVRAAEYRAKREAEEANEPPASPVVEGKITVAGELLAVKSQEGYYGNSTLKMLVRDDRGFKVWGTLPEAIYGARKGDRIEFTAQVERSHDDETFGFFRRPSKAQITAEVAA